MKYYGAMAVLVGVWPAISLTPSCSKMKSNDLLVSSRGGLKSGTPYKLSTFSLTAIDSAVTVGDSVLGCPDGGGPADSPQSCFQQTPHALCMYQRFTESWVEEKIKSCGGRLARKWHFIQENAFENVLCKMAAILPRPQCVNTFET